MSRIARQTGASPLILNTHGARRAQDSSSEYDKVMYQQKQ